MKTYIILQKENGEHLRAWNVDNVEPVEHQIRLLKKAGHGIYKVVGSIEAANHIEAKRLWKSENHGT